MSERILEKNMQEYYSDNPSSLYLESPAVNIWSHLLSLYKYCILLRITCRTYENYLQKLRQLLNHVYSKNNAVLLHNHEQLQRRRKFNFSIILLANNMQHCIKISVVISVMFSIT